MKLKAIQSNKETWNNYVFIIDCGPRNVTGCLPEIILFYINPGHNFEYSCLTRIKTIIFLRQVWQRKHPRNHKMPT